MVAENLTVAGRRFRTRGDYEAALRDQKKIEAIKAGMDLNDFEQLGRLFSELQSGCYRFETAVGNDFDDEIFDKYENLKKNRTSNSEESIIRRKNKTGKKSKEFYASQNDAVLQEQALQELRRREKQRRWIVLLASLVAIVCFGYFGIYYFFSIRTNMDYEALAELKGSEVLSEGHKDNDFVLHKSSVKMPDVLEEYKTLYEKNKKLIGWLKIDDTIIDYPVMQTSNNDYYLEHNFNQEYDRNGSLFLDCSCSVYPASTNLIIYGHHMKSGQMFGQLQKYAKESYGKKHSEIHFDSIYEKATYQVMYVFRSQVYKESDVIFKYYQFIDANSEEEFQSYMKEMAEMSLYDTGVTASFGDRLLTLSTCDHSQEDGRFVVVAKRIK